MGKDNGVHEVVSIAVAAVASIAIVGFITLGCFGVQAIRDDHDASNAAFQSDLAKLNCVHVGYRGRGEEKIYFCGGRLMQRGRDGLKYSD